MSKTEFRARKTLTVGLAAAAVLLLATSTATADDRNDRGPCGGDYAHDHGHGTPGPYYGDDYGDDYDDYDRGRSDARSARRCYAKARAQREQFNRQFRLLQRAEARVVRDAYLQRTKLKARRIADNARQQARRLTTFNQRARWGSPLLACRDDVRRFRAAVQELDRTVARLDRLLARDARLARRFRTDWPVYSYGQPYAAPRTKPTRVVYR